MDGGSFAVACDHLTNSMIVKTIVTSLIAVLGNACNTHARGIDMKKVISIKVIVIRLAESAFDEIVPKMLSRALGHSKHQTIARV